MVIEPIEPIASTRDFRFFDLPIIHIELKKHRVAESNQAMPMLSYLFCLFVWQNFGFGIQCQTQ